MSQKRKEKIPTEVANKLGNKEIEKTPKPKKEGKEETLLTNIYMELKTVIRSNILK